MTCIQEKDKYTRNSDDLPPTIAAIYRFSGRLYWRVRVESYLYNHGSLKEIPFVFPTRSTRRRPQVLNGSRSRGDPSALSRIYPGGAIEAIGEALPATISRTDYHRRGSGNFERPIAIYISVYTLVHFSRKHAVIDLVDISLPYLAAFKIHSAVGIQPVRPIRRV